jgi:hypothetical protein
MNFTAERTSIYDITLTLSGEEYHDLMSALSLFSDNQSATDSEQEVVARLRSYLSNYWGGV